LANFRTPKMKLQEYQRYEIVFLRLHKYGPKMSLADTAKEVGCDKKTVTYWTRRWGKDKNLSDKPKPGRNRITTPKQDDKIITLAKKNIDITAAEIQSNMKKRKVEISVNTIRRRLQENGGKYAIKLSKPLLSNMHQKKRLQWAKQLKDYDWNRVIFSDESSFYLYQRKRKVWQFPGKKKIFRTVKHPTKVHVWGCFSASGFGELYCWTQNLNAEFMIQVYKRGLLPSSTKLFGKGNIEWVLQEDNDPKHRSKIVNMWKEANGITVLPWPSMSPDQNPIENVWGILKIKIAKKKITSLSALKGQLTREWNRLPVELAANLVNSMEKRITALIDAKGDYTIY
jgi:transposase